MSLRNYITSAEASDYFDTTGIDSDDLAKYIELAEEQIDQYVKFQHRLYAHESVGVATSGTTSTLVDTSGDSPFDVNDNWLSHCVVEIIAGTGAGQSRYITASDKETKTITVSPVFTTAPDTTSAYRVYQLAKFPRTCDYRGIESQVYKWIPEQVKRAVLAQVEYIAAKGEVFFTTMGNFTSESIGDYSYTIANTNKLTGSGTNILIAPKAREALVGIVNIKGNLIL